MTYTRDVHSDVIHSTQQVEWANQCTFGRPRNKHNGAMYNKRLAIADAKIERIGQNNSQLSHQVESSYFRATEPPRAARLLQIVSQPSDDDAVFQPISDFPKAALGPFGETGGQSFAVYSPKEWLVAAYPGDSGRKGGCMGLSVCDKRLRLHRSVIKGSKPITALEHP